MQVLKKISLALCCLIIASCGTTNVRDEGGVDSVNTDIAEIGISDSDSFRVGMLLPLTGTDAKYGIGLKNASMLALQDVNNPKLVLQYYDTQSTPAGARIAVQNAINQRSNLIIGPLKSSEVQAISNETIYQGVPVIAFSTAQEVLQPTVYTMGLLIEEQVDRIITYATEKGRKRFALLLPDNPTGGAVARAAVKSAQKNGVEITVIGFYVPGTSNFSDIAKEMTNYQRRHDRVLGLRNRLQSQADNGDVHAQKALKKLETREGLGDVGFDALLIPESGAKLTAAISMFAYYDAAYPTVQFLGTSVWDAGRLNNEATISKSLYPTVSKVNTGAFASQYYMVFNEKPSSLYTLAYDAIGIANRLSEDGNMNINENITATNGFSGLNGKVRFFKDGSNQHSLDVVEVLPSGNIVVDSGDARFETINDVLPDVEIGADYRMPKIFGKDSTLAQILIYGQPLSVENQINSATNSENDNEIVAEQLRNMGIYIN
ncbi:MAG: penicillin-binding protein activator [Alphaproteobacteria bacterium]|nr:penicillin-binding protein activator [Alphaproteobacteria bacterium]